MHEQDRAALTTGIGDQKAFAVDLQEILTHRPPVFQSDRSQRRVLDRLDLLHLRNEVSQQVLDAIFQRRG